MTRGDAGAALGAGGAVGGTVSRGAGVSGVTAGSGVGGRVASAIGESEAWVAAGGGDEGSEPQAANTGNASTNPANIPAHDALVFRNLTIHSLYSHRVFPQAMGDLPY